MSRTERNHHNKKTLRISIWTVIITVLAIIVPIVWDVISASAIKLPTVSEVFNDSISYVLFEKDGQIDGEADIENLYYITNPNSFDIVLSKLNYNISDYSSIDDYLCVEYRYGEGSNDITYLSFHVNRKTGTFDGTLGDPSKYFVIEAGKTEAIAYYAHLNDSLPIGLYSGTITATFIAKNKVIEVPLTKEGGLTHRELKLPQYLEGPDKRSMFYNYEGYDDAANIEEIHAYIDAVYGANSVFHEGADELLMPHLQMYNYYDPSESDRVFL